MQNQQQQYFNEGYKRYDFQPEEPNQYSSRSHNSERQSSRASSELPYPVNDEEIQREEAKRRERKQRNERAYSNSPNKPTNNVTSPQTTNVTSPPKLISKQSENSVFSNTSTIYSKDLAYFQYFGHNYNQVINDTTTNKHFTPYIQLKWAITLFVFSFHLPFIQHYNINCVELHRPLNDKELHHNSRIILEHAMKVLSRLCASMSTGKANYEIGYPMALYFMGQLYSHRLDFDFLLAFFENDPIGAQQCGVSKIEYNDLLKNLQVNLSRNKILPLNDFNAFKYYEKCYNALYAGDNDNSTDWILCGVSNLFRLSVCLEYGKGCNRDSYRSVKLFYEGWKNWKDPVSGYKLACRILKESENYAFLDEISVLLDQKDLVKLGLKILNELDTPQSNFELGKFYETLFNQGHFEEYSADDLTKLILNSYLKSFELNYSLASWKLGQIYEFGLFNQPVDLFKSLNFYYKDTTFALNCLSIAGWLLTGSKELAFSPDDKESFKWLMQAYQCANGDKYGKIVYALGLYFQFGIGCQVDMEKSAHFMSKAAQLGHPNAAGWLEKNIAG